MRIGIDIMGGDFAPELIVLGCFHARDQIPDSVELVLFGDKESIIRISKDNGFDVNKVSIVHTTEQILMNDHPIKAFTTKTSSSIVQGFKMLKAGDIDSFCSAGNTGAMLVGSAQVITPVPGIIRPGIVARIPNLSGKPGVLIDVGLNPDARPDVLLQYGLLGKLYSSAMYNIENPRIGLVNIGSEEEKGNLEAKAAFQLMKEANDLNFVGNIEGNEFFYNPDVDVLVCDGFVGNIILKEAEGFYRILRKRKIQDEFFEEFNFEHYGGTPILGINKPVIVGHGISNERAIKNMILQSIKVVESNLTDKIKSAIA
jgi:glycerol-3-phosphate acyltransferase PlsX